MERRADSAQLGMCGLVKRDTLPDIDLGYALLPRFRGAGYVREAAAACLEYAADVLGLARILAITRAQNERSTRVLQSLGMVLERSAQLAGDEHESIVYAWRSAARSTRADAESEIDALVHRFYDAFGNASGRTHRLAALPYYFVPGARLLEVAGDHIESHDLQGFIAPRAALLDNGRLVGFTESEDDHRTDVQGRLAQRWSRYRKAGRLDGQPFESRGTKLMQFVRTARGFRISAMAWEDHG